MRDGTGGSTAATLGGELDGDSWNGYRCSGLVLATTTEEVVDWGGYRGDNGG
jgi:hypothetical protein